MAAFSQIIRQYATDIVLSTPTEGLLNTRQGLSNRFETLGYGLRSDELAEDWQQRLDQEIESALAEWDLLGIPRPLIKCESPHTLVTYRHERYPELVGDHILPLDFGGTLEFISNLSAREFLIVPILFLYLSGCDPILVTDAANDGGVDCIGRVVSGPLHSMCIFVQSKTSVSRVPKDTVMLDHTKFLHIKGKPPYRNYISALGVGNSSDGLVCAYCFLANNNFERPARAYALEQEIMIRSVRQLAFFISKVMPLAKFHQLHALVGTPVKRLDYNLASLLRNQLNP